MDDWIRKHPAWKSDWTKNGAIRNVQVAFNWAAKGSPKKRLIPENPFRGVSHRVGSPRRRMTATEFQSLLRAATAPSNQKPSPGARFRQFLMFLWFMGCRPGESAKLRWTDIDLGNALIIIKEHKTSTTQRDPQPRVIPLHPVVLKLLVSIRKRGEGDRVFLNCRRTPWNKNSLEIRMRRARHKARVSTDPQRGRTSPPRGSAATMSA
jgi:integrase